MPVKSYHKAICYIVYTAVSQKEQDKKYLYISTRFCRLYPMFTMLPWLLMVRSNTDKLLKLR